MSIEQHIFFSKDITQSVFLLVFLFEQVNFAYILCYLENATPYKTKKPLKIIIK